MELNREQIIKALECCTRGRKSKDDYPCDGCPYNECNLVGGTGERQISGTCQGWLMRDALALINSQEQRIEAYRQELGEVRFALAEANKERQKLTKENESLQAEKEHLEIVVERKLERTSALERLVLKLTEENERLRSEVSVKKKLLNRCADLEDTIKADTVRKMQERLHERKVSYGNITFRVVPIDDIDQIAKEMLEETDEVQE